MLILKLLFVIFVGVVNTFVFTSNEGVSGGTRRMRAGPRYVQYQPAQSQQYAAPPVNAAPIPPKETPLPKAAPAGGVVPQPPANGVVEQKKNADGVITDITVSAPPKIPQVEREEIERRGNMVQELGTRQSGPSDVLAEAITPPEDDSFKWYVTLVTGPDCPYCETIKKAFESSPELQAWGNPNDPDKSWSHFQIRDINDATQVGWFAGIKDKLNRFPAVVIQPPRNGVYGENATVVAIIYGYDGNAKNESKKIRSAVLNYVETMRKKGKIKPPQMPKNSSESPVPMSAAESKYAYSGMQQAFASADILQPYVLAQSSTPPFSVPNNPFRPADVSTFPGPQALTIAEIRQIVPDATPEFIMQAIEAQVSDANELQRAWLNQQIQRRRVKPTVPLDPGTDAVDTQAERGLFGIDLTKINELSKTANSLLGWLQTIAAVGGGGLLLGAIGIFRSYRKATGTAVLDDATYAKLMEMLKGLIEPVKAEAAAARIEAANANNMISASLAQPPFQSQPNNGRRNQPVRQS